MVICVESKCSIPILGFTVEKRYISFAGAVRKHKKWEKADEKEMEAVIKDWLRNASKRISSKNKKYCKFSFSS